MNSISDFVSEGKIGQLNLGISKKEVLRCLGEPKNWLGKSTVIGETYEFYHQSDLWFYYNGSVGVRFEKNGTADSIIIYPQNSAKFPGLFVGWPVTDNLKMGDWRAALQENGIAFREGDSFNYWIVAGQTCVTCCLPSEGKGKMLAACEWKVLMLQKFSDVQTMQRECEYLNPERKPRILPFDI